MNVSKNILTTIYKLFDTLDDKLYRVVSWLSSSLLNSAAAADARKKEESERKEEPDREKREIFLSPRSSDRPTDTVVDGTRRSGQSAVPFGSSVRWRESARDCLHTRTPGRVPDHSPKVFGAVSNTNTSTTKISSVGVGHCPNR